MSDRLFERAVRDWLEDGSDRTPMPAIDAVLLAVKTTPQERALRIPRRFNLMPTYMRLAAVVAIIAVVGAGALAFLGGRSGVGGPTLPTAAPTPSARANSTPFQSPDFTGSESVRSYASSRYLYEINYPANWTVIPGDHDWAFETDIDSFNSTAPDRFETQGAAEGLGVRLSVWSVRVEPGTTLEEWIEAYCAAAGSGPCAGIADDLPEVRAYAGAPGLLWQQPPYDTQAFFLVRERVYVAAIWRSENDPAVRPWGGARSLLEAFARALWMKPPVVGSPSPT